MAKKFEVTEKGSDIFGNKKYEVSEKNDGVGIIGVILSLAALVIATLPSGIIAIVIYLIGKRVGINKTGLAIVSSIISIIICFVYYDKYFETNQVGIVVLLAIVGLLCYVALIE